MGYNKKAGTWVPVDRKNGEVSVNQLQRKMEADQADVNEWAQSTWDRPNTLSANQIETLDGKNTVAKDGQFNAIGAPVALESGEEPKGFSRDTVSFGKMNS